MESDLMNTCITQNRIDVKYKFIEVILWAQILANMSCKRGSDENRLSSIDQLGSHCQYRCYCMSMSSWERSVTVSATFRKIRVEIHPSSLSTREGWKTYYGGSSSVVQTQSFALNARMNFPIILPQSLCVNEKMETPLQMCYCGKSQRKNQQI